MDSKPTEDSELPPADENETKPAIILKFKTSSFSKHYGCCACNNSYTHATNLRYHVRREHFNLKAKLNRRENKKIDEVWREKVANSDAVIEIKKASHCKYLMKKTNDTDSMELVEPKEVLDLGPLYPFSAKVKTKKICCRICKQNVKVSNYRPHLEEVHEDIVL